MDKAKLYLIPCLLGDTETLNSLTLSIVDHIQNINIFIVENVRSARRFIKKVDQQKDIDSCIFYSYGKYDRIDLETEFLPHILRGKDVGLISEAGLPCIADPGSKVVEFAHDFQIDVVPLVGPSSIFLALMASGLNGQNFVFHGYLPIDKKARERKIKKMENDSKQLNQTQIFMETAYRNDQLFASLLKHCKKNTRLCIATNITLSYEKINTMVIDEWKQTKINLHKKPTIFLLFAT